MNRSIYTWFGYYLPFEERLKLIKDAGFNEVIISWEDELPPFDIDRFKCAELVYKSGLNITHAHSSFLEGYDLIWSKTSKEKERFTNIFKQWVKECSESGIDTLVIHTNGTDLKDYDLRDGLDFFEELTQTAEEYKVNLAVENVSRQFLLSYIFDNIDSPFLGMCYDSGHDYLCPCGRGRLLDLYPDRIKALHLQDNDLFLDRHWLPGEGEIDFDPIIKKIKETSYPTLSLEVCADPRFWAGKSPKKFLEAAYTSVEKLDSIT